MLNIGPWELMLIAGIALIVFGPSKMPEMGRSLGKAMGEFKKAAREIQEGLEDKK